MVFSRVNKVKIIEELEHFEKAPFNINECISNEQKDLALLKFFNNACMPITRYDYKEVLKATGCKDGFELSFKGHGLSLSNHYWFKKRRKTKVGRYH